MRLKALEIALSRTPIKVENKFSSVQEMYASSVFDDDKMKIYLDKATYKSLLNSISNGTKVDRQMASQIAVGMKAWAIEQGVTHYTHWFQPLTGTTAEKHDSFYVPL